MRSAECLIIGGGPAGLSAALSVSRLLKSSIVLDSGVYRNACAAKTYNVIGGTDGTPPAELRQRAKAEIAKYGVASIVERSVQKVEKTEAGFRVDDEFEGKKLILATGAVDILPDISGFQELWGRQIVHCAFCHGTEFAQKPGALLGAMAVLKSLGFLALTPTITLLLNGETMPPFLSTAYHAFTAAGHKTIESKVSRLEERDGAVVVHFADGHPPEEVAFIAHSPPTQQAAPFAQQLGLEMTPMGDIATSGPFGATSMPDVFAAGDAAVMGKAIPVAMGTGASAGAGVANDLAYGDLGLNMAEIMQQVMSVMAKK